MRYKVHSAYLLAVLAIFMQTLVPRDFNMKYICLLILFLLSCAGKRFVLRNILPIYAIPYIAIYLSVYVIHFYNDSIFGMVVFFINIIVVRYLVIDGIKFYEEFQSVLSVIIDFFALYAIVCLIETFTRVNLFDIVFNRNIVSDIGANSIRLNLQRAHGMCTISINSGMLLTFGWGIAAYKIFNFNGRKNKLLCEYLLIGAATLLSLSRTIIVVSLGIQALLIMKRGYSFVLKRTAVLLAVFAIVYIGFKNRFLTIINSAKQLILAAFSFIIPSFAKYVDARANIGNQGARFALWSWVYEDVKSDLIFGKGYENQFSRSVLWSTGNGYTNKTSIEVHWLSTMYTGGLFALVGFISYQMGCLYILIKNKVKFSTEKVSFQYVMIVISLGYFVSLFTFTGFEDLSYFYLLMALFECYVNINKANPDKKYK